MHYACERERQRQSSDSRQCHWSRTVIGAYVNYVALTELLQWLWCYCYYCCCYRCFSARFALHLVCIDFLLLPASCSCCWHSCSCCCYYCWLAVAVASVVLKVFYFLLTVRSCSCCSLALTFPSVLYSLPQSFPRALPLPRSQVALKPVTFYSFQFVVYFLLISRFMQLSPPSPPSLLLFLLNAVWPHKICKLKVAIVLFSSFSFSSSSSTYQKYSKLWHALLIVNAFSTFCGFI